MKSIRINSVEFETSLDVITYEEVHDLAYPEQSDRRPIPLLTCVFSMRNSEGGLSLVL